MTATEPNMSCLCLTCTYSDTSVKVDGIVGMGGLLSLRSQVRTLLGVPSLEFIISAFKFSFDISYTIFELETWHPSVIIKGR